jgi:hypothetical protein
MTRPLCRYCAAPLKKYTRTIYFGRLDDGGGDWWTTFTAKPTTREEAARYSNHAIVSVSYWSPPDGERYIDKVTTWDGETYERRHGYFCSIVCAANLGEAAAFKGWGTKSFFDATKTEKDPDT